jgi:hypothetical protein
LWLPEPCDRGDRRTVHQGADEHRAVHRYEQDSGILNVALENLGIIDAPVPWLTSPDVVLIAVILVNIWLDIRSI